MNKSNVEKCVNVTRVKILPNDETIYETIYVNIFFQPLLTEKIYTNDFIILLTYRHRSIR